MKNTSTTVLKAISTATAVFASTALLNTQANAALLAFDDFESSNYVVGQSVAGLNGGFGWSTAWNTGNVPTIKEISDYSITYNHNGFTYGGGNSLRFSGADSQNATGRAVFSTANTSGEDYYVSMIFQVVGTGSNEGNSGQLPVNTGISMSFIGTSGSVLTKNTLFLNSNSRVQARMDNEPATVSTNLQYDTTYLVVAKLGGWDGEKYTTTDVWLNPGNGDEFTNDSSIRATITNTQEGIGADGLRVLNFRTFGLSEHDLYIDDMRFATSWDAVVIPEPSTYAYVGTMALAVLIPLYLRKKRK